MPIQQVRVRRRIDIKTEENKTVYLKKKKYIVRSHKVWIKRKG